MQSIHPENHLLQAPRRHHPYQHSVHLGQLEPAGLNARSPRADSSSDLRERHGLEPQIEILCSALQVGDVPAKSRNQGNQSCHSR